MPSAIVARGDGDLATARMDDEKMGGRRRSEREGGRREERKGCAWFARREVGVGHGRSYLNFMAARSESRMREKTESEILLFGDRLALAGCLLDSRGGELPHILEDCG